MATTILNHPLIDHKLTIMRNKDTGTKEFRQNLDEIAMLMAYEVTKGLPTKNIEVVTPICQMTGKELVRPIILVPILRAGIGMVDGIVNLIPNARVGHIGLYRDPNTLMPIEYYCKLPEYSDNIEMFVLEPMMATGGTASAAVQFLKERNFKNIKYICLICTPDGVQKLQADHPDVDVYAAAMDRTISEDGFIIPGLGDAGDRMFGTK